MARAKKKAARTPAKKKAAAGRKNAVKAKAGAKKAARRKRLNVTYDFVITVQNGQIGFDGASDDGNGFAKEKPSDRDRFIWNIGDPDYEFKLVFRRLRCKGAGGATHWPFPGRPPGNETGWLQTFDGEAKNQGLYKYTVHVRHTVTHVELVPLDPVIIIGRV